MCTVVILRRPAHPWPLIMGANRDEMANRPWSAPARHWPDRPQVVAGRDDVAGGSWLGINDHGVVAAVLNRPGSLGPASGKRSRGELVLEALDHAEAAAAAQALGQINPDAYRPFNLVVADSRTAFWLALRAGAGAITTAALGEGLSMLTAEDLNSAQSPRVRRYRPRFEAAPPPEPGREDWAAWQALLAAGGEVSPAEDAMCFQLAGGFGTRSSSIVALPRPGAGAGARWQFNPSPGNPQTWRALF